MVRVLATTDRAAGGLARLATTLGQCALVVLGVHLAADSLDDRVFLLLSTAVELADARLQPLAVAAASGLGLGPEALLLWQGLPLAAMAAWLALAVELAAATLLCGGFLLTARASAPTWSAWRRALCVRAVVLPGCLGGVLLAGSWSLAMGVEDLLPPSALAPWAAALLGLSALLRFGWPAWRRTVAALEPPRRRAEGLASALVLAPIGLLAWIYGVPLWGLLP